MARTRDFRAEYRARLARGEARGLSRKAARGHAGDILKRTPATAHGSQVYPTLAAARGYISRLGANRRVQLVALYSNGGSAVVQGRHSSRRGGMTKAGMLRSMTEDYMRDFVDANKRYRAQAADGTLPPGKDLLIGFQVLWQ